MPDGQVHTPAFEAGAASNAPVVEASEAGGGGESAPPVATLPVLLVYLEPETEILHWKPDDRKGARWRNSKSTNISVVAAQADEVMPERYIIDFVEAKE